MSRTCNKKRRARSCNKRRRVSVKQGTGAGWNLYPPPNVQGFGKGKMCYFISCPDSRLPIRDYVYAKKPEPDYENRTYNAHTGCNQRGIKNAEENGISYLVFYTIYRGQVSHYRDRYFITGLFPITASKKISKRMAYYSEKPIFLSIEDSAGLELNDNMWNKWFGSSMTITKTGSRNLRYYAKRLLKDSFAMTDILKYFRQKARQNMIEKYVKELVTCEKSQ